MFQKSFYFIFCIEVEYLHFQKLNCKHFRYLLLRYQIQFKCQVCSSFEKGNLCERICKVNLKLMKWGRVCVGPHIKSFMGKEKVRKEAESEHFRRSKLLSAHNLCTCLSFFVFYNLCAIAACYYKIETAYAYWNSMLSLFLERCNSAFIRE